MDRRTRLAEIFAATERFIKENPVLSQSVESSCKGTKLYDDPTVPVLTAAADKVLYE